MSLVTRCISHICGSQSLRFIFSHSDLDTDFDLDLNWDSYFAFRINGQLIKVARESLAFLTAQRRFVSQVSRLFIFFFLVFLIFLSIFAVIYLIWFRAEALIIMGSNRFDICHSSVLTSMSYAAAQGDIQTL